MQIGIMTYDVGLALCWLKVLYQVMNKSERRASIYQVSGWTSYKSYSLTIGIPYDDY